MNTVTKEMGASILAELGVSEMQAVELVIAASRVMDAQATVKDLRSAFIALLPVATESQVDAVLALVREDAAIPEGLRESVDFRFTEAQVQLVKDARLERENYVEANAEALLAPVLADVTQKMRSFKVRQTPKKVVTTVRWEKAIAVNAESRSLIARLAKATQA